MPLGSVAENEPRSVFLMRGRQFVIVISLPRDLGMVAPAMPRD
jgi:hypothetical protein